MWPWDACTGPHIWSVTNLWHASVCNVSLQARGPLICAHGSAADGSHCIDIISADISRSNLAHSPYLLPGLVLQGYLIVKVCIMWVSLPLPPHTPPYTPILFSKQSKCVVPTLPPWRSNSQPRKRALWLNYILSLCLLLGRSDWKSFASTAD